MKRVLGIKMIYNFNSLIFS